MSRLQVELGIWLSKSKRTTESAVARVMARNVTKMTAFLRPRLWMMTCDTFSMDLGSVDSKRTMLGEDR